MTDRPLPDPASPDPTRDEAIPEEAPSTPQRSARRTSVAIIAVSLVAVLAGGVLFLSGWTLGRQTALTPGTPADEAALFQPFWDTYRAVTDRYAGDEVDRKALVEGAIKGMVGALGDPYSFYMTPAEFKQSLESISGEFEGIGATIGTVDQDGNRATCTDLGPDCRMVIVAPITGSPADKAGLVAGDVIAAIDGSTLDGLTFDEARSRIRGPKGTAVTLTIERAGEAPRDVEIVRAVIITPEVESRTLADGTVGYVKLSGFSDHASEQFAAAVGAAVDAGERKLVIDLRGNPGGYITAARDIASQFIGDGTIFWQEAADGTLIETRAKPGGEATDPDIRLVVLVDGGTASASEIVTGALKDRGRATIIGTQTFGKGTVQQWTQLEDDTGGFRLTIAKWLTPDKTWIHGVGITPDIVVDTPPAKPGDDPVLDRALEVLSAPASARLPLPAAA